MSVSWPDRPDPDDGTLARRALVEIGRVAVTVVAGLVVLLAIVGLVIGFAALVIH